MSLPTDLEIKSYLRISTDVEDILIFTLNQTAQAQVVQYLDVPLTSESRTFTGLWPKLGPRREWRTRLHLPVIPCETTATITDRDGTTVSSATYTIDPRTGYVDSTLDVFFDNPPYKAVVNVGWTYHPNYDSDVDPILRQAILDLASDLWNRRNPGAEYEQSGGQVSITYTRVEMPLRTAALLNVLRPRLHRWFAT